MTTQSQIETWFDRGVTQGATHMLVVCDTFDHEDYPAYAQGDADAWSKHRHYSEAKMQTIMEVYDLKASKAAQMAERRAMHMPPRPAPTESFDPLI